MKVAIAGGSGFLGRHVADELRARGHAVRILARGTRPRLEGVEWIACDVTREVSAELLRGCDALANLVGIKREHGAQSFEAVHVDGTRRMLAACRAAGIDRFLHVSVACSRPDPDSAYHDTKWRAEELVRESGLAFTILRPGVIYGRGDDMVTHLVRMLRFAPLFPVVGRGDSLLQPVDAQDVAAAAAAALERPVSVGRSFDVVGARTMRLREVVATVAEGASLPVHIVPTPIPLQRAAVRLMNALFEQPLSTPAQLQILIDGMCGDPEPAARHLGLRPRAFTAEAVRELEPGIGALFGFSLRLADRRAHREWLAPRRPLAGAALALAAFAPALQLLLSLAVSNVWHRMAVAGLVLSLLALRYVDVGWRELYRPSLRHMLTAGAAALALYAGGWAVVRVLAQWPAAAAQMATLYGWKEAVPNAMAVPLLLFIVCAEEIVWRAAVGLPLAARWGAWRGTLLAGVAFAAAHVPMGIPVLVLAAFAAGTFWSALVVKTRSGVPALVSHVLWDLAVLFWLPYRT